MKLEKTHNAQMLQDLYDKAADIEPLAEKDGKLYVSFADAAVINSINAQEKTTGMQVRNRDGSIASTGKTVHAINPDYFYMNRYLKKGKKMYIVSGHEPIGFRCIQEQQRGTVHIKMVPCYVLARDAEGNVIVEAKNTVPDTQFIADFTESLSNSVMAEVLPLIVNYGVSLTKIDKLPI